MSSFKYSVETRKKEPRHTIRKSLIPTVPISTDSIGLFYNAYGSSREKLSVVERKDEGGYTVL